MPEQLSALTSDPRGYAARLTERLADACDGALMAAYLHGSAALGGWVEQHSDVDVLFVVADGVAEAVVGAAGDLLLAAGAESPGSGLECSLVTASAARYPAAPWPFVQHVNSGEHKVVLGSERGGDPDLLMHYAVCRAAGVTLLGPPPRQAIGPIGRAIVLGYLADEAGWGLANAPECYAVLNACRALAFLRDGRIVSKVAGGLAALEAGSAPAPLVRRALDQQQARAPERQPGPDAIEFVEGVAAALRSAAERAAAGRTK